MMMMIHLTDTVEKVQGFVDMLQNKAEDSQVRNFLDINSHWYSHEQILEVAVWKPNILEFLV